jgi:hypothetical protein
MCSLRAGKMTNDNHLQLAWDRYNLGEQGRKDLAEEQTRSWERIREIVCEDTNRRAETGEPGTTYVVTSFGFERSRPNPPEPSDDAPASDED